MSLLIRSDILVCPMVNCCSKVKGFINPAHSLLFSYIFIVFVGINSIYFSLFNWLFVVY